MENLINTSPAQTQSPFIHLFIQPLHSVVPAQEPSACSLTHQGLSYPSHRSWCPWTAPCLYTDTPCWQAAWRQLLPRCVPCFEAHIFDIAEPTAAPRSCNPLRPQPWCPAGRDWSLSPSLLSGRLYRHQLWPESPLQQWLHVETVKIRGKHKADHIRPQKHLLHISFCISGKPEYLSLSFHTSQNAFHILVSTKLHIDPTTWYNRY